VTASIVATAVWSQGESMNTSTIRACFRAVFGVYLVATCRSKSAFKPVGWRRKGARASSTSAKARKWASN